MQILSIPHNTKTNVFYMYAYVNIHALYCRFFSQNSKPLVRRRFYIT